MTGLTLSIDEMNTQRGLTTTISLAGVRLNEDGRDSPLMAFDAASTVFDLSDLAKEVPTFKSVSAEGAVIHRLAGVEESGVNDENSEFYIPVAVEKVDLQNVTYQQSNITADGQISVSQTVDLLRATGSILPGQTVEVEGEGIYRNAPFTFAVSAPETATSNSRGAVPVSATISGPVDADLSTILLRSGQIEPIIFSVSGPTVSALSPFAPVVLPETPPFELSGTLTLGDDTYDVTDITGQIGDSDISGNLRTDLSGALPFVEGSLRSRLLDFDDLASLIGATPDTSETASKEQLAKAETAPVIPTTPVPSEALRTAEFDIRVVAEKVSSPVVQVESIDARLRLDDARLEIKPLSVGVSGGTADGEIALNVREDVPSADINLNFSGVSLTRFFDGSQFAQETGGQMSGAFYLLGTGSSLDAMFASARGDGRLLLRDGKLSALLVEAAGLDVAESLGVVLSGDEPVAMPCAGITISADQGRIDIAHAEAATTDSLIAARGAVDLDGLSYNILIEAQAWDFSLLDLNAPVQISGVKSDFSLKIGQIEGLPFFAQGTDLPRSCDALFDRL